jgi:hypothetical protein
MSEKMIFCIGEGAYINKGKGYQQTLQIFNVPVSEEVYDKTLTSLSEKSFKLPTIKAGSYKEAWEEMWTGLLLSDKKFFTTLPNFNADIFEQITGIKPELTSSLKGKTVKYEAVIK